MYVYKTLLNDVTIAAGMELDLPRCCDATLRENLEKVSISKQRERDEREKTRLTQFPKAMRRCVASHGNMKGSLYLIGTRSNELGSSYMPFFSRNVTERAKE